MEMFCNVREGEWFFVVVTIVFTIGAIMNMKNCDYCDEDES